MNNYSKIEKAQAEPDAPSMIESFRAIGYSVETAIADIIDNSISAGASNIWIDYNWKGSLTTLSIIDDGKGMTDSELINAMRPGSKNPLDNRDINDLGRFGLGLKTASFSQCRKFSVVSKSKNKNLTYWAWDLDFIKIEKSWTLIKDCPNDEYIEIVKKLKSGTAVIWWDMDRITSNMSEENKDTLDKFMKIMENVKKHLSMVFHRIISEGTNIFFKGRKIEAWDPFMIGTDGLQPRANAHFDNKKILVKGFVLPHRSKLSVDKYNYGKGPKDSWTAHQGFYVYRNKRLIVMGDWLGFFKREVHYDLCRVMVDIPNGLDEEWQIDIKKSIARIPLRIKEHIIAVAKEVRMQAVEVYRHKGKILKRNYAKEEENVWLEKLRHGKRFYKINREHTLIKGLFHNYEHLKNDFEITLKFIEETVPIPLITLRENEHDVLHCQPFEGRDHEILLSKMISMFENLKSQGKSETEAKAIIMNIEPFNFYPEYLENLKS